MTYLSNIVGIESQRVYSDNISSLNNYSTETNIAEYASYSVTGELNFYVIASKNYYKVLATINGGLKDEYVAEPLINRTNNIFHITKPDVIEEKPYITNNNELELLVYTSNDQDILPAITTTTSINISYWS